MSLEGLNFNILRVFFFTISITCGGASSVQTPSRNKKRQKTTRSNASHTMPYIPNGVVTVEFNRAATAHSTKKTPEKHPEMTVTAANPNGEVHAVASLASTCAGGARTSNFHRPKANDCPTRCHLTPQLPTSNLTMSKVPIDLFQGCHCSQ